MIDDWYDVWQVNLMGQIWVLRQFLPAMVKMDRGSIIFMWVLMNHSGVLLIMINIAGVDYQDMQEHPTCE